MGGLRTFITVIVLALGTTLACPALAVPPPASPPPASPPPASPPPPTLTRWHQTLTSLARLAALQATLQRTHATWRAGLTSRSLLSPTQGLQSLGLRNPDPEIQALQKAADLRTRQALVPQPAALPASWDWRDAFGKNWLTPVRDQQECGACWAFASVAAMEAAAGIFTGQPDPSRDLSEQFLVSCSNLGDCNGGTQDLAFSVANPVPDEACLPYLGQNGQCAQRCADWRQRGLRFTEWSLLINPSRDQIKAAVQQQPVVARMLVFPDFYDYAGGVYAPLSVTPVGGHGVLLIGWDDATESWIAKNSWGTDWGEAGYFRIAWDNPCDFAEYISWPGFEPFFVKGVEVVAPHQLAVSFSQPLQADQPLDATLYLPEAGIGGPTWKPLTATLSQDATKLLLTFATHDSLAPQSLLLGPLESTSGKVLAEVFRDLPNCFGSTWSHWQHDAGTHFAPGDEPLAFEGPQALLTGDTKVTADPGAVLFAVDNSTSFMVQGGSLVLQGTPAAPVVSHVGVTLGSLSNEAGKVLAAGQFSARFAKLDGKAWLRLNGPPVGSDVTASALVRNTELAGLMPVVVTGQGTLEILDSTLRSASKTQGLIIGAASGSETARLTVHGSNFLQFSTAILLAHVDQTPGAQNLGHNYFNKVSQNLVTTDGLETGVGQVLPGPVDPWFFPTLVRLVEDDLKTTKEHLSLDSPLPLEVSGVGADNATVNYLLLRLRAQDTNPEGQFFYLQETAPDSNLFRPVDLLVASAGEPGLNTLVATLDELVSIEDLGGQVLLEARVVEHCDDDDPCTLNLWVNGACSFVVSDDLDCSKGRLCEGQFKCQAGACVQVGPPPVCEDAKGCFKAGVCDPYKGCQYPYADPGTACDADSNGCTINDQCVHGLCMAGAKASCTDPLQPCLAATCTSTGPNQHTCEPDLEALNGQECLVPNADPPKPGLCDHGQCVPEDLSCEVDPICCPEGLRLEDALPCDDADLCTSDDACLKGVCTGQPVTCDDLLACTQNLCLPAFGCLYAPIHLNCPAIGVCRAGLCDPETGCGTQAAPDWTDCGTPDDLQACFGGTCKEFLAENRCETAATLEPGVTRFFTVAGLRQYFDDPPGFELTHPIRELFIQVPTDLNSGATLLLSPDPGVDLAQAAWNTCQDETPFSGYIDSKGPGALEYMAYGGELLPGSIVEVLILEWPNEEARISMLLMNPPEDADTISGADASTVDDATGGGGGGGGGGCTFGPRATTSPLLLLLLLLTGIVRRGQKRF